MNLNKVIIAGNLTKDPERKSLPSGQAVANFGVATNRFFTTPDGQKHQEAEFHNVVVFGRLAETVCQYLKKGSLILIEGRLRTRNWQDNNSVKHYRTEIVAERIQLGPRAGFDGQRSNFQPTAPNPERSQIKNNLTSEEEIPVIEEKEATLPANPLSGTDPFQEESGEINVEEIPF